MNKIFKFIGEYKNTAILTIVYGTIETISMRLMIPFLIAKIIDNGIMAGAGLDYIVKIGLLLILLLFISLFFSVLNVIYASKASRGFGKNLRQAIFDRIQVFSFHNIDKFSTASLITRLTSDITKIQDTFMMIIRMMVRTGLGFIGSIVMAMIINLKLSIVFMASAIPLFIVLFVIAKIVFPRFIKLIKKEDELNLITQENFRNIRIIKSFVREHYETNKFNSKAGEIKKAQIFSEKLLAWNSACENVIVYSSIIAILWFGGGMVMNGNMKIGELSAFLTYNMQVLFVIMFFAFLFVEIMFSKASMTRIMEVLEEQPDIVDGKNTDKDDIKLDDGSIEFKNVSFSYDGDMNKLNLKNINLKINAGETVGIIGGAGAGKSTLVHLLVRLYDTTDGELEVGGHNIKDYKLKTLRDQISVVLQKNTLFSGTIKENLLWGNENATNEEIIDACKKAQAHDFIMSFPNGYDTHLEQGAVNISGGQKQRLCIARALLKKPKILILDDSTSAVDTTTEAKIWRAFNEEMTGITKIIIAQRISSIENADKIIVMDAGKVNSIGNHEELLKNNDIYKVIYQLQCDKMAK